MRRGTRAGIALLLLVLVAVPTAGAETAPCADEEDGSPAFEAHQSWITQSGTKAGNLSVTPAQDHPTWHDEEPTTSYQEGGGSGYLATRASDFVVTQQHPVTTLTLEGTFTGCLDVIAVELYMIDPADGQFAGRHTIRPQLLIDGLPFYQHTDSTGIAIEVEGDTMEDTALVGRFAFTGIHELMQIERIDPEGEHTIQISVTPQFANSGNVVYVYDAAEVPSNLHFNGPTPGFTEIEVW